MTIPRIVILGAGFGGLTLATELDPLAAAGKARVTLVDRNERFSMGFSMQWVLMGRRQPAEGERPYTALRARHVEMLRDEVTVIDTERRLVRTAGQALAYDYLVVALGAELSLDPIPGLAGNAYNLCDLPSVLQLKGALEAIEEGTIAVVIASTPFKCPPAPYEYALLIDDLLRARKVRDKIRIVVTTPEPQPMPVAGKAAGDFMEALLAERGIAYLPLHKPVAVSGGTVSYENGFALACDLLCAMPVHRAPQVAREAGLTDSSGFIPVALGTFATAIPRVYAVGDAAAITLPNGKPHPKAGVFAEAQAKAVEGAIAADLLGTPPTAYAGVGTCYIDVGDGKAAPAEVRLLEEGGPQATFGQPSAAGLQGKELFEAERLRQWFRSGE